MTKIETLEDLASLLGNPQVNESNGFTLGPKFARDIVEKLQLLEILKKRVERDAEESVRKSRLPVVTCLAEVPGLPMVRQEDLKEAIYEVTGEFIQGLKEYKLPELPSPTKDEQIKRLRELVNQHNKDMGKIHKWLRKICFKTGMEEL